MEKKTTYCGILVNKWRMCRRVRVRLAQQHSRTQTTYTHAQSIQLHSLHILLLFSFYFVCSLNVDKSQSHEPTNRITDDLVPLRIYIEYILLFIYFGERSTANTTAAR